jgi:hypothetical protein
LCFFYNDAGKADSRMLPPGKGFRLVGALLLGVGCSSGAGPAAAPLPGEADRVLFIGNSLTEANELPLLVEALSLAGGRPLQAESVTFGGVSLEDHWARGTQQRIASGGWRFVVLQQGPSALPESRANLREWTRRFDAEIRRAGGRTALYMVWPESFRREAFPDVSESYRLAAQDVGGILLPAGDAWQAAWRQEASLPLYGSDGFHPSPTGSYLAALTIYAGLTGGSPLGMPRSLRLRSGRTLEVDSALALTLQSAAAEALAAR